MCVIKDICSNRIVGYSIDSRMKASLAVNARAVTSPGAVKWRVASCPATGVAISILRVLARVGPSRTGRLEGLGRRGRRQYRHGIVLRAAAEERPEPTAMGSREQLRIAIVTWTERTYRRRRYRSRLDRLTPVEYEAIMTTPATQGCRPTLSPDRAAVPFNAERGFGFTTPDDGSGDVFVRMSGVARR